MILKIQKPVITSGQERYLIYNKRKSTMINDVEVGQNPKLDNMFGKNENKIYVEGYIDKKDRLIIKNKVDQQEW